MLEKFALKMNKQNHKTIRATLDLSSSALHIHPTTSKKKRGHESGIQLYKTGLQHPDTSQESTEKHLWTSEVEPETDFAVGLGREALAELRKEPYTVSATPHLALAKRVNYVF